MTSQVVQRARPLSTVYDSLGVKGLLCKHRAWPLRGNVPFSAVFSDKIFHYGRKILKYMTLAGFIFRMQSNSAEMVAGDQESVNQSQG